MSHSCRNTIDEENAARQCEAPKHAFVHIMMDPYYVSFPLQLRVNNGYQISVNGGIWHGNAFYHDNLNRGTWELTFHYKSDESRARSTTFLQVPGTASYMHLAGNPKHNAILITRTENIAS